MAHSTNSVLFNHTPNVTSQFVYWTSRSSSIALDPLNNRLAFVLPPNSYMYQRIPPARFYGSTPVDFLFNLESRVVEVPLMLNIEAKVQITIKYKNGRKDVYLYPLLARSVRWKKLEDNIVTSDDEKDGLIDFVDVEIFNDSEVPVRVSYIALKYSLESRQATDTVSNDPDKMILYGLEADLPILR